MLKKGALGTREIVLDPESASKVYQEGIGNIIESPSTLSKVAKTLSRTLPIAGGVLAVGDAVQRAQEGDYAGAALSGLGALPVVGIPATVTQYATAALGLTGQAREEGLAILPEVHPTYTSDLSLLHLSKPTSLGLLSNAVFCLHQTTIHTITHQTAA